MFKSLIRSMRLRTLPLSLSGIICGGVYAYSLGNSNLWANPQRSTLALIFLILTTISLQILSNLSNEMGDHLNGVDNEKREGPNYGMTEGGLTEKQMWRAINTFVIICALCGLLMTLFAHCPYWILLLGAAAIWAATHYTLGKKPYGYRGLGDLFVFLFFGLVSVIGSYFVIHSTLIGAPILPAVGIGLLSVAVLNVNNIRDMASDEGIRQTVPLRLGERRAKWYHTALVVVGFLCLTLGRINYIHVEDGYSLWRLFAYLFTLPLYIWHLVGVWRHHGKALDPMLPLLVMSTFLLSIIYTWGNYGI